MLTIHLFYFSETASEDLGDCNFEHVDMVGEDGEEDAHGEDISVDETVIGSGML
jgi:hypothetical protein